MDSEPIHPKRTRKSKYRYRFTKKHHRKGKSDDAQWDPELTRKEEFTVFDDADFFVICDEMGRLFGVLRTPEKKLRELGTWKQQIAEFPKPSPGDDVWHGYPVWPVKGTAPANRANEKLRPPKAIFLKLEEAGLITKLQRKRLYGGGHA